jgi:hypothetical protein
MLTGCGAEQICWNLLNRLARSNYILLEISACYFTIHIWDNGNNPSYFLLFKTHNHHLPFYHRSRGRAAQLLFIYFNIQMELLALQFIAQQMI